jgi:hypothetical protein
MFRNYGKFERYSLPDDHPEKPAENMGAKFWRNDEWGDWYQVVRDNDVLFATWATVRDDGVLHAVENEMSRILPYEFTVVAFDQYDGDLWELRGRAKIDLQTGEITPHDPDAPAANTPRTVSVEAIAELIVTPEGEVTGVDTSVNIGAAFPLTPDYYIVYFQTPQPDTNYLAFVQSPGFNVDVTWREADFFEIQVTDRQTGEPATPTSLSITVQRVR